jgi:hypothetical protein
MYPGGGYAMPAPQTLIVDENGNITEPVGGVFVVSRITMYPPADLSLCRVYVYLREVEGGLTIGEGAANLDVVRVVKRPTNATVVYVEDEAATTNDPDGLVYIDIVRGAQVSLQLEWPGVSKTKDLTVPDEATYNAAGLFQETVTA